MTQRFGITGQHMSIDQSLLLVSEVGEALLSFASLIMQKVDQSNRPVKVHVSDKLPLNSEDDCGDEKRAKTTQNCLAAKACFCTKSSAAKVLKKEQAKQVMQVSLITMLVDLCDKTTFRNCQHSVQNIPIEYFSGRILLVGLNPADQAKWCVEPSELSDLAELCECPVLWGSLTNPKSASVLADQILKKLYLLSCQTPYFPSVLL